MEYNREQYRDRSRMVLRQFTGRGAMAVKELSQMTGITENQINADRDYLREGSIPFSRMAIYGSIFGDTFWNALIGSDGFAVVGMKRLESFDYSHHLTETIRFAGTYADFWEDRNIDHRESQIIIPMAMERASSQYALVAHLRQRHAA